MGLQSALLEPHLWYSQPTLIAEDVHEFTIMGQDINRFTATGPLSSSAGGLREALSIDDKFRIFVAQTTPGTFFVGVLWPQRGV